MSPAADARAVLRGWRPPSTRQAGLRDAFVRLLESRDDATSRDCVPDHLTASALVLSADGERVLLTLHRRLDRWLQTGGHCEPTDASLAAAALREATEESGIEGLRLDPEPVLLDRHRVPCGPVRPAHHLDVQYVATAPAGAVPRASAESADLAWFGHADLPTTDDSVRALVAASRARLGLGLGAQASATWGSPAASETPSR